MVKIHKVLLSSLIMPFSFIVCMEDERPAKRQKIEPQRSRIGKLTGDEPVFQEGRKPFTETTLPRWVYNKTLFNETSENFEQIYSEDCNAVGLDVISKQINFNDFLYLNIFHRACMLGDVKKVSTLIKYGGADINKPILITDDTSTSKPIIIEGIRGLHLAAMCGHTAVVELLLNQGASINEPDVQLMTPLHHALANKHIETAKLLLKYGARTFDKDKYESTIYDYALRTGDQDLLKYIGESMLDDQYRNFLHRAVLNNDYKLVKNLLLQGIAVDTKDGYGKTALHFACEKKNKETVQLLLAFKASILNLDSGFTSSLLRQGDDNIEIIKLLLDASDCEALRSWVKIKDLQYLIMINSHNVLRLILNDTDTFSYFLLMEIKDLTLDFLESCIKINPELAFIANNKGKPVLLTGAYLAKNWQALFLLLKKGIRDNYVMQNYKEWLPKLLDTKDLELLNVLVSESEEIRVHVRTELKKKIQHFSRLQQEYLAEFRENENNAIYRNDVLMPKVLQLLNEVTSELELLNGLGIEYKEHANILNDLVREVHAFSIGLALLAKPKISETESNQTKDQLKVKLQHFSELQQEYLADFEINKDNKTYLNDVLNPKVIILLDELNYELETAQELGIEYKEFISAFEDLAREVYAFSIGIAMLLRF